MKERPIIFSGDMVQAILDGRKTQTRRPVKPTSGIHTIEQVVSTPDSLEAFIRHKCPHGRPGDRLWVRETFWEAGSAERSYPEDDGYSAWWSIKESWPAVNGVPPTVGKNSWGVPEGIHPNRTFHPYRGDYFWRKRSSIHMPRWACRLVLEVVSVRVERVQEITEEGARAEGVRRMHEDDLGQTWKTYRRGFQSAWDSIYAAKGHGWDANPWVWVTEFKVAAKTLGGAQAILEAA